MNVKYMIYINKSLMHTFILGLKCSHTNLYLGSYSYISFEKYQISLRENSTNALSNLLNWRGIHDSREMESKECCPQIKNAKESMKEHG